MPPILGHMIVIAAIAALVFVCARYLWNAHKRGGCAGCRGGCGGGCSHCSGCGRNGDNIGPLPDLRGLRVDREGGKR